MSKMSRTRKLKIVVNPVLVTLCLFLLIGCEEEIEHPEGWPHVPVRPADIPTHNCSGQPINWTWKYQRAYNEGNVSLVRSDEGCVIAMVIKVK
jgi:hypothetical protein